MVRHITGGRLSTGLLTRRPPTRMAGDCRSCGGDGGWYEDGDNGKKEWVTCKLCNGSGSR